MKTLKIPTEFKEIFEYDENSPTYLVDKQTKQPIGTFVKNSNNLPESIVIKKGIHNYKVHRIIWFLFYNDPENYFIDHIDGNPWNNRIDNLRKATATINQRNKKMQANNCTGFTGVKYVVERSGSINVVAYWIDINGKKKSKHFNIRKLGHDIAIKMAAEFRETMIREVNALGGEYSETHGKR